MSDNVILNPGTGGATIRTKEISGVQVPTSLVTLTDGSTDQGFVGRSNPMPVRSYGVTAAKITYATQATISAGGQAVLDSAQISSGKLGHLIAVIVTSSVPFKADIRTVSDGVESATKAIWFARDCGWYFNCPDRDFITVSQNPTLGLDGFRAIVTNLDTSEAADIYGVFYYDEE